MIIRRTRVIPGRRSAIGLAGSVGADSAAPGVVDEASRPLLEAGLVDALVVYVGPMLLGTASVAAWDTAGPESIAAANRWHLLGATVLGDDLRLDYEPAHPEVG